MEADQTIYGALAAVLAVQVLFAVGMIASRSGQRK
jgi:hypothetical protein